MASHIHSIVPLRLLRRSSRFPSSSYRLALSSHPIVPHRRQQFYTEGLFSSQLFALFVAALLLHATDAAQDSRRNLISRDQATQATVLSSNPSFPSVLGRIELYKEDGMSSQSQLAAANAAESLRQISGSHKSSATSLLSQPSQSSPPACDLDNGSWEVDDAWPLYQSESCPFARQETMCAKYGRPNLDYAKLRWVLAGERGNPNDNPGEGGEREGEGVAKCSVTKMSGSNLCKRVTGHRIVFVGDSLSQNAFESMACLMHRFAGMPDVRMDLHRDRVYHWPNCNFTIAFSFHQFLSEVAWNKVHVSDGGAILLDQSGRRWMKHMKAFDTFVINSGHWWSERQLSRYNITFARPYESLNFHQAYQHAINTTLREFLHPELANKQVFFTASAPSHDIHGFCPQKSIIRRNDSKQLDRMRFPWTVDKNKILVDVVRKFEEKQSQGAEGFQGARIKLLDMYNVTLYRQEAHPSTFNARGIWDCLHYCLPGVPDAWNEILLWQMEVEKGRRAE